MAPYTLRMPPRVGVPLCLDERGRWRTGRDYHYIDASYARALERAGASVRYLPIQRDVGALVRDVDALLVPGGDDLPPPDADRYARAGLDPVPPSQLAFDRALLAEALAQARPVLGICYGLQLLALESSGRLVHHLPTDRPDAAPHRLAPAERHAIELAPRSRLAGILGSTHAEVNSWHHQAVAEVGAGWRISARAADGVIEAIERDGAGAPFQLGVQWHPEKLADTGSEALFRALVEST